MKARRVVFLEKIEEKLNLHDAKMVRQAITSLRNIAANELELYEAIKTATPYCDEDRKKLALKNAEEADNRLDQIREEINGLLLCLPGEN